MDDRPCPPIWLAPLLALITACGPHAQPLPRPPVEQPAPTGDVRLPPDLIAGLDADAALEVRVFEHPPGWTAITPGGLHVRTEEGALLYAALRAVDARSLDLPRELSASVGKRVARHRDRCGRWTEHTLVLRATEHGELTLSPGESGRLGPWRVMLTRMTVDDLDSITCDDWTMSAVEFWLHRIELVTPASPRDAPEL